MQAGKVARGLIRSRIGFALACFCVLAFAIWIAITIGQRVIPVRSPGSIPAGIDASQPKLVAKFDNSWRRGGQLHEFHIPREYVDFSGIELQKGRLRRVPIVYELPSKLPPDIARSLPSAVFSLGGYYTSLDGVTAQDHIESLMCTVYGCAGTQGPSEVEISDGRLHGLLRYSRVDCFNAAKLAVTDRAVMQADPSIEFDQRRYREVMAARPADDPVSKPYCHVTRHLGRYFTDPEATPSSEQVYIDCMSAGCHAVVNITPDFGVYVPIPNKRLHHWQEIATSTRELVNSFRVAPAGTRQSMNSAVPSVPAQWTSFNLPENGYR
jgi:hypothetical protein